MSDASTQPYVTYQRGEFFGELAIIKDEATAKNSAVCHTDCTLLVLKKHDFDFIKDIGTSPFLSERKTLFDVKTL